MILGALLIISVVLTVTTWIDRNNKVVEYNELQKQFDDVKTGVVHDIRTKHHNDVRMVAGAAPGCDRCKQLLRELNGAKVELANAYTKLTTKQKDELQYTYDVVAKNVTVDRVADSNNAGKELIQISFTVKNQSSDARGNMHGRFSLYKDGEMAWQKNFTPPDLAPGATSYVQFMAPGEVLWDVWGCQIYPSKPSNTTGAPRQ